MHLNTTRWIAAGAFGLLLAATAPGTAATAAPSDASTTTTAAAAAKTGLQLRPDLVWMPFHAAPQTVPAGLACAFPLHLEPISDAEQIATPSTFPDGTPRVQIITGGLRVRFTNVDTGAALERDLDGTGVIVHGTDGSLTVQYFGPGGLGFRPTDPFPAGYYVLRGYHAFYVSPDRALHKMLVDVGTEENLCPELA
jgi:hypothetical protein